jgi:hypothetical protein
VLALAWPDEHVELVHGTLDGRIVWPAGTGATATIPASSPRHAHHGRDDGREKNAISHRGRAFRLLVEACFDERAPRVSTSIGRSAIEVPYCDFNSHVATVSSRTAGAPPC